METDRRHWLKKMGLIAAGLWLPGITAKAMPVGKYVFDEEAGQPVRLSSNENPYGPSPHALDAMIMMIGSSNRYQWQMIRDLKAAIAVHEGLTAEHVLVGAGSTQIIDACIQYCSGLKGTFVYADPTFSRWKDSAANAGLKGQPVPLSSDKSHDLPAMQRRVNADTRFVYICNPNNPTGTICPYNKLVAFVRQVSRNATVLVDEAYLDYSGEPSLAALVKDNKNLIIIKTFSKVYGLAGGRIGYALAHSETIDRMNKLQSGSDIGISATSLAAALASLKDREFVRTVSTKNEQVRNYTVAALGELNIRCIPSHTNFLYFSLEGYSKDYFGRLKANNIEGTYLFEEQGKWSRITIGTMEEMQLFIKALQ